MTTNERPSATAAAKAVDAGSDRAAKIGTCRGVLREAMKICMEVGGGTLVEGIEEVQFGDALHRALIDYLKAKESREFGSVYLGITANLQDSARRSGEAIAAIANHIPAENSES